MTTKYYLSTLYIFFSLLYTIFGAYRAHFYRLTASSSMNNVVGYNSI